MEEMKRIAVCWIMVLLILSSFTMLSLEVNTTEGRDIPGPEPEYTPTGPITIAADYFVQGVTGGIGTANDPYIIEGWDINSGDEYCILIYGCTSHFIIRNCRFNGYLTDNNYQRGIGVHLNNSMNGKISSNVFKNIYYGVWVESSDNNNITGNLMTNCRYGIYIDIAHENEITNNDITSPNVGISVHGDDNQLSGNILHSVPHSSNDIWGSSKSGISIYHSQRANISNNVMNGTGIGIVSQYLDRWNSHTIGQSNTVNGKPVYYWKNKTVGTVPDDAGQVILANCSNIIVEDQIINNTYSGIITGFSTNCIIRNNVITNTSVGLIIRDSSENNFVHNNSVFYSYFGMYAFGSGLIFTNNNMSYNDDIIRAMNNDNMSFVSNNFIHNQGSLSISGSLMVGVSNFTISDNYVYSNGSGFSAGGYVSDVSITNNTIHFIKKSSGTVSKGISIGADNANISNNEIVGARYGIVISSDDYKIYNNLLYSNEVGIHRHVDCENGIIYHNSFINNTCHVEDYDWRDWDNGYPVGGNYWDDYDGEDNYSGPAQNVEGSDGIGDTPYQVTTDNEDNYPLMAPTYDIWLPSSEIEDIPAWHTASPMTVNANVEDQGFGLDKVNLWYQYSDDDANWSSWTVFETDYQAPWSWNFTFPEGVGYYRFVSMAVDLASNQEIFSEADNVSCRFDPEPPIAIAGPDQAGDIGDIFVFNSSKSTDNVEIKGHQWFFTYDGELTRLLGEVAQFQFDIHGNYTVTLNVTDLAGNWALDELNITVYPSDFDDDGIPDHEDVDDDNDGFPDEWEDFLNTNATDPDDYPLDTDGDGIPDGNANNTQPWMDFDDDNDGVQDFEDYAPLDPSMSDPPKKESSLDYLWVLLIIVVVIVMIIGFILMQKRKKPEIDLKPSEEIQVPENDK